MLILIVCRDVLDRSLHGDRNATMTAGTFLFLCALVPAPQPTSGRPIVCGYWGGAEKDDAACRVYPWHTSRMNEQDEAETAFPHKEKHRGTSFLSGPDFLSHSSISLFPSSHPPSRIQLFASLCHSI